MALKPPARRCADATGPDRRLQLVCLSRAQRSRPQRAAGTLPALTVGLSIFLVVCCTASARPNNDLGRRGTRRAAVEQLSRDIGNATGCTGGPLGYAATQEAFSVHAGVDRP